MHFATHAPFSKQVEILLRPGCNVHFGQFGEDILLPILFGQKTDGFYVDVGCHDPFVYSNTYLLHSQYGWRGINVDASPTSVEKFKLHRPNDININLGVSNNTSTLKFYMFQDGAVNTFNHDLALQQSPQFGDFSVIDVNVEPLGKILSKFAICNHIDYMNIDCEGLDYDVVLSNDWSNYRPAILTVELHNIDPSNAHANPIVRLLDEVGYRLHSLFWITGLFQRRE